MPAPAARSPDPPCRNDAAAERRRRNAESARRSRQAKKLRTELEAAGGRVLSNFPLDGEMLARLARKFPEVLAAAERDDDLAHELHELLDIISWQ